MLTTMGHPAPGDRAILSGDCQWRAKRRRQILDKLTPRPATREEGSSSGPDERVFRATQGAPSMARVAHLPSGERLVGWIVTVKAMREPRAPSPVR